MKLFALIALLAVVSVPAFACRPVPNYKYPTLEENFKRASAVFFGTIQKVTPLAGEQKFTSKVEFKVEHSWKGPAVPAISVTTSPSSSCDRLGYELEKETGCLIFLDEKNTIISNMMSGEASFCLPKGAPRLKTLVKEFDKNFESLRKGQAR